LSNRNLAADYGDPVEKDLLLTLIGPTASPRVQVATSVPQAQGGKPPDLFVRQARLARGLRDQVVLLSRLRFNLKFLIMELKYAWYE
jgi:hypothetical protein